MPCLQATLHDIFHQTEEDIATSAATGPSPMQQRSPPRLLSDAPARAGSLLTAFPASRRSSRLTAEELGALLESPAALLEGLHPQRHTSSARTSGLYGGTGGHCTACTARDAEASTVAQRHTSRARLAAGCGWGRRWAAADAVSHRERFCTSGSPQAGSSHNVKRCVLTFSTLPVQVLLRLLSSCLALPHSLHHCPCSGPHAGGQCSLHAQHRPPWL